MEGGDMAEIMCNVNAVMLITCTKLSKICLIFN